MQTGRHENAAAVGRHTPQGVSKRLGHTSIGTTLDTYSHVMPGMQKEAAEKIDAGLRAALAGSRQSTLPAEAFCDI